MNTISKLKDTKGNNSAKLKMEQWLLFSAYHLMLLHICSKIMKISLTVQSFRIDTIFILNTTKENNSEKKWRSYGSCSLHIVRRCFIFVPSFMKISMTVSKL